LRVRVDPVGPVVPGESQQSSAGHVRSHHDEPVLLSGRQAAGGVGLIEVAEVADAQLGELVPDPAVDVVTLVDAELAPKRQALPDDGHAIERGFVPESRVVERRHQLGQLATPHARGDERADDRSRGGSCDPGERIAALLENGDRPNEADPFHPAPFEDEIDSHSRRLPTLANGGAL